MASHMMARRIFAPNEEILPPKWQQQESEGNTSKTTALGLHWQAYLVSAMV